MRIAQIHVRIAYLFFLPVGAVIYIIVSWQSFSVCVHVCLQFVRDREPYERVIVI